MDSKNRTPAGVKPERNEPVTKQFDKFKEAARELEAVEDERAFDEKLKKVAKHKTTPDEKAAK